ncbi:MAG TPA: diacylglycerol kinase family protein [Patescibacteria group bacterium]
MSKKENLFGSFGYAFAGIAKAFKSEPNLKVHLIAGVLALLTAYFFKVTKTEWLILALTITLVIILELINTVIETITDIVSPRYSPRAKIIKDVSAGAVAISAILAVIVGVVLFLPRIWQYLH